MTEVSVMSKEVTELSIMSKEVTEMSIISKGAVRVSMTEEKDKEDLLKHLRIFKVTLKAMKAHCFVSTTMTKFEELTECDVQHRNEIISMFRVSLVKLKTVDKNKNYLLSSVLTNIVS